MSWDVIADNLGFFAQGAKLTLFLTVVSLGIAFLLSMALALGRNSHHAVLRHAIAAYTLVFRGTPLLVQLFLIYYGLAQFDLVRTSLLWPWLSSPLVCTRVTFVLNLGLYDRDLRYQAVGP